MLRRIGMRAHDYGKLPIEELTKRITKDKYKTIQLALKKAIAGVDEIEEGLTEEIAKNIHVMLLKCDIDISVFGAYLNYATLDDAARKKNVAIFCRHLELAPLFGARVVGTETGSLDINYKPHSMNDSVQGFNRLRESLEQMIETAVKSNAIMAIEPVAGHILNTATRTKEMIKAINSPNMKVIFDPVNIITPQNYLEQEYLISEMFEILGEDILVVHGKDYVIENGKKIIVSPGKGMLNYKLISSYIKQSTNQVDLLAENNPISELERINTYFSDFFV